MIFIANADGSINAVLPSTVNQGSNQANEIVLIAPIIQSAVVDARFNLPNGAYTEPFVMARYDVASTEFSEKYNAWHCLLDEIVTSLSGDVGVQFTITIGNTILTTTTQVFNVGVGVGYIEPEISYDHYEELKGLISSLGVDVENIDTGLENLSKEVEDIKKGKQTAIAFNSYEEMISSLNEAPNTEYYVSKNIMIKTLDVPDLWVYSVESTSEPYIYSSDDEIVKKLNEDGTIRVGYYTLAQLEAKETNLNLENGEGVGSIKAIYDTKNGPVGSSGNTSESYKPEANGKNGMALTPRAYANGDCAIAGGWSASANTKGDVALSAGQAGMTEAEFNTEYPNGYPWRTNKGAESITVPSGETYFYSVDNPSTNNNVIHYLTYAGYKALIQNSAFASCNGKALGIKSSAIGDGTVAHEGQAVTGKFNKESGSETYEDGETLNIRDAIAIIGNGRAEEDRSNAIEVYKNHIKSKVKPTHPDDIARLQELNSLAKNKITGGFGSKKVDDEGNVLYDNTNTQIIRSAVSVLTKIDEDEQPVLDDNGNPIGGSFYADKQISSPRIIGDIVEAKKITINGQTIGTGGSDITVDTELSTESENPVQNKVITEALAEKLDLPTQGDFGGTVRLSAIDTDGKTQRWIKENPVYIYNVLHETLKQVIPSYKEAGKAFSQSDEQLAQIPNTIFVAEPILDYEATNKKYVDDNKGTKIYKHTITGNIISTGDDFEIEIVFYSLNEEEVDFAVYGESEADGGYTHIHINAEGIIAPPYCKAGVNLSSSSSFDFITPRFGDDVYDLDYAFWISDNDEWYGEYTSNTLVDEVVGV